MKETQHIEWKESWRDEYLRWICGFANAEGGVLVIGRNDKGEAVGVKDASRLLQDIPNKVRDILGIMVDVNLIEEAGQGNSGDRGRALPVSGKLQGRVSLPQRQHQARTQGCSTWPFFVAQAGATLGRCTHALRYAGRPG